MRLDFFRPLIKLYRQYLHDIILSTNFSRSKKSPELSGLEIQKFEFNFGRPGLSVDLSSVIPDYLMDRFPVECRRSAILVLFEPMDDFSLWVAYSHF